MKKILALTLLAGTLATQSAFSLTVTPIGDPNGFGPWQTGLGGEITLQTDGSWDPTTSFSSKTSNQGGTTMSFQSFCVEGKEDVWAGHTYSVSLNSLTVPSGDKLSRGAAWLYSQFAQGALNGYDYANTGVGRLHTADLLQQAIWHYMVLPQLGFDAYDPSNPFEVAASGYFGSEAVAIQLAGTDNYGTSIINLVDVADGSTAQDMLVYGPRPNIVRTPDGGATLMLLGMGLSGLAFVSRRIRR